MNAADQADKPSAEEKNVSSEGSRERLEVVVIGAGQAGLAIGHLLADDNRSW